MVLKKHVYYALSLLIPATLNAFFSSQGAFNFVSPLFCIPVIIGVFYYAKRGLWLSFAIAALYAGIEIVFQPDVALLIPMLLRIFVYILIAVLVYQLQEQETKTRFELNAFFNNNTDLMCVSNRDGNFVKINPAFEKVLGYQMQELKNKPFLEFVHPEDRAATLDAYKGMIDNIRIEGFVNRYRCKDDSYKYIEWSSFSKDNDVYSTAHDITEQKLADQLQKDALERYKSLIKISDSNVETEQQALAMILSEAMTLTESSHGLMLYVDHKTQSFSLAIDSDFQIDQVYTTEKIENSPILNEVLRKGTPVIMNQPEAIAEYGKSVFNRKAKNLLLVPVMTQEKIVAVAVLMNKSSDYDHTDGLQMLLLMKGAWEIVLKRRVEKDLIQERRWFESTLLSINDGVVATDPQGIIRTANSNAAYLTSVAFEELAGKAIKDCFVFQQRDREPLHIWIDIFPNHETVKQRKDLIYISQEGKSTDVVVTASEIRVSSKQREGYLFVFQDVTQQNKNEQEIIYLTYHDKLTELYNRRFYEEEQKRLDQERNLPISIIIGDVNGLKLTNDAFGHLAGDQLLIAAADAMRSACRQDDVAARWGGDEYVILLPKTGEQEAASIAERIQEICSQKNVENIQLSIALGWATKISLSEDISSIVKRADDMMYKRKLLTSRSIKSSAVKTILKTLHEKSRQEEVHSMRVSMLSTQLGKSLGLTSSEITDLEILGKIHDIGKIAIDKALLSKPGSLAADELEVIRRHSETGYNIVSASPELSYLANSILANHERWDGTGYPNGLKGAGIPLLSRIICIADAYEAMTGERPYRESLSKQEAIAELKRCAGSQFDPQITATFIGMIE